MATYGFGSAPPQASAQMDAAVDAEEPSPERHRAKRGNDDSGQSRTVLQYHAGPARRGKDTKRANAAGGDAVAGTTPLQPRSPVGGIR